MVASCSQGHRETLAGGKVDGTRIQPPPPSIVQLLQYYCYYLYIYNIVVLITSIAAIYLNYIFSGFS